MVPSKRELREISEELQHKKSKAQKFVQPLLISEDPLIAERIFEITHGYEDATKRGQKRI